MFGGGNHDTATQVVHGLPLQFWLLGRLSKDRSTLYRGILSLDVRWPWLWSWLWSWLSP